MTPEQLIQQLASGDDDALRELYGVFSKKIYNTCLAYLQVESDAEEAMQDVFVEVYRSVTEFNAKASVNTWIYRIAVNKCLDRIRYNKRQKRFAFISSLFSKDTGAIQFDQPNFNHPGVLLENKEKSAVLFKAINQLPENQRMAFILKHVEGLSQKEIAEIINIGEKAVESLLQRAKGSLRKLLSDFYDKTEGKNK